MSTSPTNIIFLWHMHQPFYKFPQKRFYFLPWVRLHGTKDYYGMARLVKKFNKVKVTFNFSGILLNQLLDYIDNNAEDYYSILTLKNPRYLTRKEKSFIIERFFSVNFERFIRPNKRYLQLYQKKLTPKSQFSSQEIQDLQVLFNLCWFHPYTIKEDKNLKNLIDKEKSYTQEDKEYIIKKQYIILSQIIPLYKKLLREGRIEISLTPYAHPILPLIYDTEIIEEFPYLEKPAVRFSYPNDCRWHIDKSQEIFKKIFDRKIKGSWPAEGGISADVAKLYEEKKFNWILLDEGILFKSLTTDYVSRDLIEKQRHLIYRGYKYRDLNLLFRDRNLSDAISFIYQGWDDPVFAANDLLEHFRRIHYHTSSMFKERVITIAMDGENAWEYYKNNGVEFLETVYSCLEKSQFFTTTTPSRFCTKQVAEKLEKISSGSWINSDFSVWIGSKKNNFNWYILKKLRDLIDKRKGENLDKIKEYFYILEGSDWNWWNTFEDVNGDFRKIFLSYVKEIYRLLNKRVPSYIKNEGGKIAMGKDEKPKE